MAAEMKQLNPMREIRVKLVLDVSVGERGDRLARYYPSISIYGMGFYVVWQQGELPSPLQIMGRHPAPGYHGGCHDEGVILNVAQATTTA